MSRSDPAPASIPLPPLTVAAVDPDAMEALGQALDDTVDASPPPERAAPPAPSASPGGQGPLSPEASAEGKAPGYSGQEWRDKVKATTSGLHAEQRRGKGRYRKKGTVRPVPGMNRRMPPQPPGSTP